MNWDHFTIQAEQLHLSCLTRLKTQDIGRLIQVMEFYQLHLHTNKPLISFNQQIINCFQETNYSLQTNIKMNSLGVDSANFKWLWKYSVISGHLQQTDPSAIFTNLSVELNDQRQYSMQCFTVSERIWAPFHAKVPIERAHLWYVESMSNSLNYIAT